MQRKASAEDILSDLQKTGIYHDLELKRKGNGFTFKVGKCLFAGGEEGVHRQLGPLDVPCALALFVGGYIAKENPSRRVYAYPSIFNEEGSITEMELLSTQEYGEKIRNLDELSCVEKRAKEKLEKPIRKGKGDCHDYAKRAV